MNNLENLTLTMPGHAAIVHALVFLVAIGYAQNYYFHLRKSPPRKHETVISMSLTRNTPGHHKNNAH
jgi:hypothetical protein